MVWRMMRTLTIALGLAATAAGQNRILCDEAPQELKYTLSGAGEYPAVTQSLTFRGGQGMREDLCKLGSRYGDDGGNVDQNKLQEDCLAFCGDYSLPVVLGS